MTLRSAIGRAALGVARWRVTGPIPDAGRPCIFVGAPHTSGWDSPLMIAVAWRYDLSPRFLIKKEIGDGPFRWVWRPLGAISVDREDPAGLVDRLIRMVAVGENFQLVLTPKGTRKKVDYWKSGFYRLAHGSGLPIIMVSPDGPTRTVTFAEPYFLTGDLRADMNHIRAFFADKRGIVPSRRTEPRLRWEDKNVDDVAHEEAG